MTKKNNWLNRKKLDKVILEKLLKKQNWPQNELIIIHKEPIPEHIKINLKEKSKTTYFPENTKWFPKGKTFDLTPYAEDITQNTLWKYYANKIQGIAVTYSYLLHTKFTSNIDTTIHQLICDGKIIYDSTEWDKMLNNENLIVLDTETTGFTKKDEILQLTILNGNRKELFNQYFKPNHTKIWENAEKCNHISPKFVADKPSLLSQKENIESLLKKADLIIGYNTGFDIKMLEQNGIKVPKNKKYIDIMIPYAEIKGVPNEYGQPKWFKLIDCAKDYDFPESDFHNSLGDTKATLHCYLKMIANRELYEEDIKDPNHLVGYNPKEFARIRGIPTK